MLEARGITYAYPGAARALYQGFDLAVAPDERVALCAPSGFGKTTLCRLLAGYERPQAGEVLVAGEPLPRRGACPVQMIWQHPEAAVDPRMRMGATLAEAGADVRPVSIDGVEVPGCLQVAEPRALQDGRVRRLFSQGKLLVSDAASQLVAASVLPAHMPASFLEIGSGRGTKTILLQSGALRAYGSQMELVALDNHAFKTDLLRERAEEYGVHVADAVTGDATMLGAVLGGRRFDAVFIDAPCSGLGTLRRHPEIRWRLTEEHLGELAALGLSLLRSAAGHVARGGQLAYATCTVTHTENNAVVKRFLESPEGADFELAPIAGKACVATRLAPGTPDAHFAVRFARKR